MATIKLSIKDGVNNFITTIDNVSEHRYLNNHIIIKEYKVKTETETPDKVEYSYIEHVFNLNNIIKVKCIW